MFGRVDRKRKVAPCVMREVRQHVHEVAVYLRCSDGDAGARLVMAALDDTTTLSRLAPFLARDYARGTRAWLGHRRHEDLDNIIYPSGAALERLWMRFVYEEWASLDALAFALARPVAHAAAALLTLAYRYPRVTQLAAPGWKPHSPYSVARGVR